MSEDWDKLDQRSALLEDPRPDEVWIFDYEVLEDMIRRLPEGPMNGRARFALVKITCAMPNHVLRRLRERPWTVEPSGARVQVPINQDVADRNIEEMKRRGVLNRRN